MRLNMLRCGKGAPSLDVHLYQGMSRWRPPLAAVWQDHRSRPSSARPRMAIMFPARRVRKQPAMTARCPFCEAVHPSPAVPEPGRAPGSTGLKGVNKQ